MITFCSTSRYVYTARISHSFFNSSFKVRGRCTPHNQNNLLFVTCQFPEMHIIFLGTFMSWVWLQGVNIRRCQVGSIHQIYDTQCPIIFSFRFQHCLRRTMVSGGNNNTKNKSNVLFLTNIYFFNSLLCNYTLKLDFLQDWEYKVYTYGLKKYLFAIQNLF